MDIVGIHNHITPRPPLYVRQETPKHFKSIEAKDRYYDKKFESWHHYNGAITPMHKFFLDECTIPDGKGRPINPYWRDCDSELFEGWRSCEKTMWDCMVIKRRELILSTFGGGVLPLYTALTNPGSDSVMTSASKKRLEVMFRRKTEFMYDRLDPYYRQEKVRKTQSGQLFIATEDKASKTFSGLQSSIWSVDTVKDPLGFESFRASYIFIDEAWIHPHSSDVKASANSSRMDGFDRICPILIGGTVGLMSGKGAREGLAIYKSSKETRTNVIFLGGIKGIKQFSVNGWCDEKAAEEWILRERERLSKAEDKTEYFKFLTSYPLTITEVFNLVTDCALPQEYQLILNEADRQTELDAEKPSPYTVKETPYRLINTGTTTRADADMTGKINIVKPPVRGHKYIMGIDPIPLGNNALGEGSKLSAIILDLETMEFVAHYTERNLNPMEVVNNIILLQKLYFKAKAMLENNRGEVVLLEYVARGETDLLAKMPTHLGIVWEERKYPWGFHMGGGQGLQMNARCENYVIRWLVAHGSKCRLRQLIHEVRQLSTEANTDLLDAAKGALLYKAELDELNKIVEVAPTTHTIRRLVRNSHGQMVGKDFDSILTI